MDGPLEKKAKGWTPAIHMSAPVEENRHKKMFFQQIFQNIQLFALLHGCFSRFLNGTNATKSRNASHIAFFFTEPIHN